MKKVLIVTTALAALLLAATAVLAQAGSGEKIKGDIARVMGESLRALPHYSYQQRTNVQKDGEDKGTSLVQVAFGPDGKPIVTPISSTPPQGRQRIGVRGAIQKDMEAEAKQDVADLVKLATAYTILDQAKMQDLMARSVLEIVPSADAVKLVVSGFLQPGDQAIYKYDMKTLRQTHLNVTTSAGGNPVTIHAVFETLSSGMTYAAQTDISMPAKGLVLTVNTLNYVKQ